MAHKTLINGTAYTISGGKTLVNGTGYSIENGKTLVGGTAYDIEFGRPLGDLAVGSSVFIKVNGVATEFLIVHRGLPSSLYDSSCDGTWLLMKNLYEQRSWASTTAANNDYEKSGLHTYLNDAFFGLLDSNIRSAIKQVKIPYHKGAGNSGYVASGANGLSTRIFLLAGFEVGATITSSNSLYNTQMAVDGARLSYFSDTAYKSASRIAYHNGKAGTWWLRTPKTNNSDQLWSVNSDGAVDYISGTASNTCGVRPALVLPNEFII